MQWIFLPAFEMSVRIIHADIRGSTWVPTVELPIGSGEYIGIVQAGRSGILIAAADLAVITDSCSDAVYGVVCGDPTRDHIYNVQLALGWLCGCILEARYIAEGIPPRVAEEYMLGGYPPEVAADWHRSQS